MADVWVSQNELVTNVLKDLQSSHDAHMALTSTLFKNVKVLETACSACLGRRKSTSRSVQRKQHAFKSSKLLCMQRRNKFGVRRHCQALASSDVPQA